MSIIKKRCLFVFNYTQTNEQLQKKIACYQRLIKKLKRNSNIQIETHVLYIMPKIPSYALRMQCLAEWAMVEESNAKIILANLGRILAVSEIRHHLRAGNVNLEAISFAGQNGINKVIGYTSKFRKYLRILRRLKHHLRIHFSSSPSESTSKSRRIIQITRVAEK